MMSEEYYNRYTGFLIEGKYKTLPFIQLDIKPSDYYETYIRNRTRFDQFSEKYYNVPYYTWLILQANPTFGGLEFQIPDGSQIRIPYPLETTLHEYNDKIKQHIQFYGL